jgi:HPt (histidine-containing phosphotransfer) domain-containing protein
MPNRAHVSEFEPARLLDIFNNDRLAVAEILAEAETSTREIIDRLSGEISSGDEQAVVRLLHTLTGVSANIGANGLSATSRDLLEYIRQNRGLPAQLVERLRSAHERLRTSFQEYLRSTS